MRVILATVGTRGDVQPMLALARALHLRGHEACVACPEHFGAWVRSFDVEHCALGEDLQAKMVEGGATVTRSLSGMKHYFREQLLLQAPRLLELARGAHAIVGTAMAWSAPSVAQKLGCPALVLFPSNCARSRLHPPPLLPWYGLPQWGNAMLWWLNDAAQNRLMGEPLNAARALLGLPPLRAFTEHLFVDTPGVIAADETFLPPDPAWQGRYPYSGFLFLDDPTPLDPALDAWLAEGEPPICIGFGSMAGGPPERVAGLVREVMRTTQRRCLVLAGSAGLLGAGACGPQTAAAQDCCVVASAPHAQLFPRVAVVVHHGGSGTTAAALRAGVPQVVLPMMLDQFHHAQHLVRAGLAPKATRLSKVTAPSLSDAIKRALELPAEPRARMAARLQRSRAGDFIVDQLEHMVGVH